MVPEAMAYLTVALDYLQAHSVRRDHIDWPALRLEAKALAAQAQTLTDTYPAIRRALELLDDEHSHFLTPEQVQRLNRGQEKRMGFQMLFP